jgi:8-oxo-dGTP pyrophosphatase MutT (NUDIX family)
VSEPVARTGGRLIMLDDDGRVLLIEEYIDDGSTHWITPGGGVEDGEDIRAAALREAWEETGLRLSLPEDAPEVFTQRRRWSYDGVVYDQTDHFFAVQVPSGVAIAAAYVTPMEQQTVIGERWWTVDELRASGDVFEPPEIAALVESLRSR